MRGGATSVNSRWGNSVAILAGDYLFAHASRLTSTLGPDAVPPSPRTGDAREGENDPKLFEKNPPSRNPAAGELTYVDNESSSLVQQPFEFSKIFLPFQS